MPVILFASLLLVVSCGEGPESEGRFTEPAFIDIFRKTYPSDAQSTGVEVRIREAAAYIEKCCETDEAIVEMLKRNGFEVGLKQYETIQTLETSMSHDPVQYDKLIFGNRSPGILRFWQITTTYGVGVYFKDGERVFVGAKVYKAMP